MKIWRCKVCGYLHLGEVPPEYCPRCGAPRDQFEEVDESQLIEKKELTQEDIKRIEPVLFKISYGMFIVGAASKEGRLNAQTANTVFQLTSKPLQVAVCLNNANLTTAYIKESGYFSVCVLGQEAHDLVRHFGFRSGREVYKFENIKYRVSENGLPLLDECLGYLECRVKTALDVGTHTLFVGEVIEGNLLRDEEPMTYAYYRATRNRPAGPAAVPVEEKAPVSKEVKATEVESKVKSKRWECRVCGYIHEGDEPPETCPVCGAPASEFVLLPD